MNSCFLFPGQGSQSAFMGVELLEISKNAKKIFECASDIFKEDFLKISKNATEKELMSSKIVQPLIVATNLAAFYAVSEKGFVPDFLAGHSLGQYSSLFAAGVVSLEATFKILKARILAIENMPSNDDNGANGMCAIIGAPLNVIKKACKEASSFVVCANENSPIQTVISGKISAINEVVAALKNVAKKTVLLQVPNAFHSKLMEPAAKEFEEKIKDYTFNNAKIKIISNITGKILKNEEIKSYLIKHLTSPVLFTTMLSTLQKNNVQLFIELGNGRTLSGLVRKTLKNVEIYNVNNKSTFSTTYSYLKANFNI